MNTFHRALKGKTGTFNASVQSVFVVNVVNCKFLTRGVMTEKKTEFYSSAYMFQNALRARL